MRARIPGKNGRFPRGARKNGKLPRGARKNGRLPRDAREEEIRQLLIRCSFEMHPCQAVSRMVWLLGCIFLRMQRIFHSFARFYSQ